MNILQVHLELSDKPPKDTTEFKDETINLPIDVKNSKDPIHLVGKRHYYVLNKQVCDSMELHSSDIVHMYRSENLYKGTIEIDKEEYEKKCQQDQQGQTKLYVQDEICPEPKDLEDYSKVVLVRSDIVKNNNGRWQHHIKVLPLANLNFSYSVDQNTTSSLSQLV